MIMAVLLMTACSSEQNDVAIQKNGEGRVALQLTACMPAITTETVTRASGNQWEANDAIGVFALQHNTNQVTTDGNNVSYTVASTGSGYKAFNPTGAPLYLPIDGSQADICAYYPYQNTITYPTQVPVSMLDQTDQAAIDWMTSGRTLYTTQGGSTPITRQNPMCQLLFSHKMCKLQFNIVNDESVEDVDLTNNPLLQIVGMSPVGYLNLLTGGITTNGGNTTPVFAKEMGTAATGYKKSYEAIMLPQVAGDCQVSFILGTSPSQAYYTFIMPARTFEAGNRYIYNVTIRNKSVSVTSIVLDWITGMEASGTVII